MRYKGSFPFHGLRGRKVAFCQLGREIVVREVFTDWSHTGIVAVIPTSQMQQWHGKIHHRHGRTELLIPGAPTLIVEHEQSNAVYGHWDDPMELRELTLWQEPIDKEVSV